MFSREERSREPDEVKHFQKAFGPGFLDASVRDLIKTCWMMMPGEKTVDDVEREIHRLLQRAFNDIREDARIYGQPRESPDNNPDKDPPSKE